MEKQKLIDMQNFTMENTGNWENHKKVSQGSSDWHSLRENSIGSSEAAAVFPSGISKTVEPYQLKRKLLGQPTVVTAFMQNLFDIGAQMEPVLRKELMQLTGCPIIETGVFTKLGAGNLLESIKFNASLDGVLIDSTPESNYLCITEFKYRAGGGQDCGWAKEPSGLREYLGVTVWCQVQHQMWVSGIHSAMVYSGSPDGCRRLWHVEYSEKYIEYWLHYAVRFFEEYMATPNARFTGGEKQRVLKRLEEFMDDTVVEIKL